MNEFDINFDNEWDFIISETHRNKDYKEKKLKNEVLFTLQLLLQNICSRNDSTYFTFYPNVYFQTKNYYLKFGTDTFLH